VCVNYTSRTTTDHNKVKLGKAIQQQQAQTVMKHSICVTLFGFTAEAAAAAAIHSTAEQQLQRHEDIGYSI